MSVVVPCGVYTGPLEEGEKFVQPLRELAPTLLDFSGPMRFVDIQQIFDPYLPYGEVQCYWKALYMDRMDDDMVWGLLTNHGKAGAANETTTRLHASILMAGRHQEAA